MLYNLSFNLNRDYAIQLSVKDNLIELAKELNSNCIKSCRDINSHQSNTTECKLRLNATETLLAECMSKKKGFTANDLLKSQIEKNAEMMEKCINQPNTKIVKDSNGYFQKNGGNEYNTSSPHCDTIAKQYEKFNTISYVFQHSNKRIGSSNEDEDQHADNKKL